MRGTLLVNRLNNFIGFQQVFAGFLVNKKNDLNVAKY